MGLTIDPIYTPNAGVPGGVVSPYTPSAGNPQYGAGAPVIKTRTFKLDTAQPSGAPLEIDIVGNFIWAFTATDLVSSLNVRFNDQVNESIPVTSGFGLGGPKFNKLYIDWAAQAGKTVTLMFGILPDVTNFFLNAANALNTVNINGVVNVAVAKEQAILSYADVTGLYLNTGAPTITPVALLSANSKRLYAMITLRAISGQIATNPDAGATGPALRICEAANTTLAQGIPMGLTSAVAATAGTTVILQTTAAISAILFSSNSFPGGAYSFSLLEVNDS